MKQRKFYLQTFSIAAALTLHAALDIVTQPVMAITNQDCNSKYNFESASKSVGTLLARAEQNLADENSTLQILPFVLSGARFTISAVDGNGAPLPHISVFVDQEVLETDDSGQLSLIAPEKESFEIGLIGNKNKKFSKHKFKKWSEKIWKDEGKSGVISTSLLNLEDCANQDLPSLCYAPPVIAPGEPFLLIGNNFAENMGDNRIEIDGLIAPVLSSSKKAILALAPLRLTLGPLREISVISSGKYSNCFEVDVAKPFFSHVKVDNEEGTPEKGKVGMSGTSIPCLIKLKNKEPEHASLWSPKQEPLGADNLLLSPGGTQNYLDVDLRRLSSKSEPRVSLSIEQELDCETGSKASQMLLALCKATIVNIQRQRLAIENRLNQLREPEKLDDESSAKHKAEFNSLSARLGRLNRMLVSRKAIFESLGMTDAQYRLILDESGGASMLSLNLSVHPIQIISDGGVGTITNVNKSIIAPEPKSERVSRPASKGRPQSQLEPVIRLLPPMSESERIVMTQRNSQDSENNDTQRNELVPNGDAREILRPGIPESEPPPSAAIRSVPTSNKVSPPDPSKSSPPSEPAVTIKKSLHTKVHPSSSTKKSTEKRGSVRNHKTTNSRKRR